MSLLVLGAAGGVSRTWSRCADDGIGLLEAWLIRDRGVNLWQERVRFGEPFARLFFFPLGFAFATMRIGRKIRSGRNLLRSYEGRGLRWSL